MKRIFATLFVLAWSVTSGRASLSSDIKKVLHPCRYPTEYSEKFSKQYCAQRCLDLHYACRGGEWEVEDYWQEVECSLHDSVCKLEPGLYIKGCPVFSEYLLSACK